MVFGNAWYRGCEGVFYTTNAADCAHAISQIQDGYVIDHWKVRAFLCALDRISVRGYVEIALAKHTSVSSAENVAALTAGIQRYASRLGMRVTEKAPGSEVIPRR